MTPDERRTLIARIASLPSQLEALVRPLSPEALVASPLSGEWSVAQIVHHLADSHMVCCIRIKLLLTEEHPAFVAYSQPAFGQTPDATQAGIQDSLDLLQGLHARWVRLLESLPEEAWARTGYNPQSGSVRSLDDILRTYAHHGEAHLDQIRRTLAA